MSACSGLTLPEYPGRMAYRGATIAGGNCWSDAMQLEEQSRWTAVHLIALVLLDDKDDIF